jgi:hypothetical protein
MARKLKCGHRSGATCPEPQKEIDFQVIEGGEHIDGEIHDTVTVVRRMRCAKCGNEWTYRA